MLTDDGPVPIEVPRWRTKFPTVVGSWRRAWPHVIPFFAFPPDIHRVRYTTNALKSIHARLRKIIKTRGHFSNDDAAIKLIWRCAPGKWRCASSRFSPKIALSRHERKMNPRMSRCVHTLHGWLRKKKARRRQLASHSKFRTLPIIASVLHMDIQGSATTCD